MKPKKKNITKEDVEDFHDFVKEREKDFYKNLNKMDFTKTKINKKEKHSVDGWDVDDVMKREG